MAFVKPCRWLLVVYTAVLYEGIQKAQVEAIQQTNCLPEDVFFTKARQPVQVVLFSENKIVNAMRHYPSIASEQQCMSICKSTSECNSIEYDNVTGNCTLKTMNRFQVRSRVRLIQASGKSNTTDYYEKRVCSPIFQEQIQFVAVVPTATDCQDLYIRGWKTNGVYAVKSLDLDGYQTPVLCQMEIAGGGWTVVQQRLGGGLNMDRGWNSYKAGFGGLLSDFWFGNEYLHNVTSGHENEVMFILTDTNGDVSYPLYDGFNVKGENQNFGLSVGDYRYIGMGTQLLDNDFKEHNNYQFSTKDNDNDGESSMKCAESVTKVGFWYGGAYCYNVNVNGILGATDKTGMVFKEITGYGNSVTPLKKTQMLVRRV